jgi:hypothetical protein
VIRLRAGPVAAAVEGNDGARADDVALVGAGILEGAENLRVGFFFLLAEFAEAGLAREAAVGIAFGVRVKGVTM